MASEDVTIQIIVNDKGIDSSKKKFDKFNKDVDDGTKGINNNLFNVEKSLKRLKREIIGAFAIKAVVGDAIKTIRDFDESVADLSKTTNLSTENARALAKEVIKIDTRTSVTNLLELASAAGRLGLQGDDIIGFVEQTDKAFVSLGDSLEGNAEEIGLTLGKLASQFGIEEEFGISESINKIGSSLNELGANSKAQEGRIIDFTNRLAGVASQANISITDVQALGALFDSTGQSIEVAATTLNVLLPAIGEDVERFAKVAGLNVKDFKKLIETDAVEALKLVAEGSKSNSEGLTGLSETLENYGINSAKASGIVGVLSSNVDKLTILQKISNEAFDEATSISDEFAKKNETVNAKIEKLDKTYDQFLISLEDGDGIISKTATVFISAFDEMLSRLTQLNEFKWDEIFNPGTTAQFSRSLAKLSKGLSALGGNFALSDLAVKAFDQNIDKLDNRLSSLDKEQIKNEASAKRIVNTYRNLGLTTKEAIDKYKELAGITSNATDATKKNSDATEAELTLLEKLEKIISNNTNNTDNNNNSKERSLTLLEKQIKLQRDFKREIEGQRGLLESQAAEEERLAEEEIERSDEEVFNFAEKEEEKRKIAEKSFKILGDLGDELLKKQQEIIEKEIEENLKRAQDEIKIETEKAEKRLEIQQQLFLSLRKLAGDFFIQSVENELRQFDEIAQEQLQAFDDIEEERQEQKKRKELEQKELELEAFEGTEEEREKRKKEIEEEKKEFEDSIKRQKERENLRQTLDQEREKLEKKAFNRRKLLALGEIAINLAEEIAAINANAAANPANAFTFGAAGISQSAILTALAIAKNTAQALLVRAQKFKDGKILIQGAGTETSDSIPAMISKNESVINARSSKKHSDVLKAINEDKYEDYFNKVIIKELYLRDRNIKPINNKKENLSINVDHVNGRFMITNPSDISKPILDAIEERNFININTW